VKIGIIGTGNMGTSLGRLWAQRGHTVQLSFSRDEAKLHERAAQIGATAGSVREAVKNADVVLLSVPWDAVPVAVEQAGDLTGKLLVTCCTPLNADMSGLTIGTDNSGAETIQGLAPGARVVEAFNSVFATIFESGNTGFGNRRTTVFYCGDDAEAKKVVAQLIEGIECDGVDAGPLSSARYIEPMGALMVRFALALGRGTNLNLSLLSR
jgi:predicted dinucleotide-binding enzyme